MFRQAAGQITRNEGRKQQDSTRICSQERENVGCDRDETTASTWSLCAQVKMAGACWLLSAACGTSLWISDYNAAPSAVLPSHSMATPFGSLIAGVAMDRWGRRPVAIFGAGLFVIGWWVLAAAQNHATVIAGALINGYCKGHLMTVVMVLTVEFSDPSTRGTLVALVGVAFAVGCGLAGGLGLYLDRRIVSGLASLLPLVSLAAWFFLPESAVWLARKHRMIEARRTLRWVCGTGRENQAQVEHEDLMRRRRQDEEEDFRNSAGTSRPVLKKWRMLTSPTLHRPFFIGLILNVAQAVCGAYSLVPRFANCAKREDEFLVELLRVPALLAAALCLRRVGRRYLSVTSGLCSCACALTLGVLHYVQLNNNRPIPAQTNVIVTLFLALLYVESNSWGFSILSLLIPCELLPGKVRATLCGVIFAVHDIFVCIIYSIRCRICDVFGTYGMLWILAIASVLCTIFVYIFLPETKDRSCGEIQDHFRQRSDLRMAKKPHSQNIELNNEERSCEFV
ncbi:facilitated trehalose transporter Tret1-like isoform X2 [Periplaneta americana]|uniref:facilitated trehalose transporter Tret1-like isoform X2 n=1 Tax=Periplaneta americana TaxID=6978 RepID=UPI0037E8BB84